jgi:hypothetical protein
MPRKKADYPSLRRHKASGQGVVTLRGKGHFCGVWPGEVKEAPAGVRAEYDRAVAEWVARGRMAAPRPARERLRAPQGGPGEITIAELMALFTRHAEQHYRDQDGRPTGEQRDYVNTLRPRCSRWSAGTPGAASSSPVDRRIRPGVVTSGSRSGWSSESTTLAST